MPQASETTDDIKQQDRAAAQAAEGIFGSSPFLSLNRDDVLSTLSKIVEQGIRQPTLLVEHEAKFIQQMVNVLFGKSDLHPNRGDHRFRDDWYSDNPFYRTLMQGHLAWSQALTNYVDALSMDQRTAERAKFLTSLVTDAWSPTNTLLGNPAAIRRLIESKGTSALKGVLNMIHDIKDNGGMPSQVNKKDFELGRNLALSEGAVVFRNEVLELIQYTPKTAKVYRRPYLLIPPQINKFYLFDVSPGRSLIEYFINNEIQTFIISWRNPTPAQRNWGIETYVDAIDEAVDAVRDITGSSSINTMGACSGGMTFSIYAALQAARKTKKINSLTLFVSLLDVMGGQDTTMGLFMSDETIEMSKRASQFAGVLEGQEMGRVFAWLRPNDLIWNYWVNNYLMGNEPPSFDVLYWNNDTTRLPAKFHGQLLDMQKTNPLTKSGVIEIHGTPIDLKSVKEDLYMVTGTTDHITPWRGCYKNIKLFGGDTRFVLSRSGHIQSIINPPGNPKSSFYINEDNPDTPDEFLEGAEIHQGTWWPDLVNWLQDRSGAKKNAPKRLGNAEHLPGDPAPGTYVLEE